MFPDLTLPAHILQEEVIFFLGSPLPLVAKYHPFHGTTAFSVSWFSPGTQPSSLPMPSMLRSSMLLPEAWLQQIPQLSPRIRSTFSTFWATSPGNFDTLQTSQIIHPARFLHSVFIDCLKSIHCLNLSSRPNLLLLLYSLSWRQHHPSCHPSQKPTIHP